MKSNRYTILFLLLIAVIFWASCVQQDEFEIPIIEFESPSIGASNLITIGALRTLLDTQIMNSDSSVLTFEVDNDPNNDKYIVGFVISDDSMGNFFEELIIQDAAENPTRGIKVLIDANPLNITYQFGRKVFVKLDGLSAGYNSGVLSLGIQEGNTIQKIAESEQRKFLIRDTLVADIVPKSISILDFNPELTNLHIRLTDMQFNRNQVLGDNHLTFAGEIGDQFDGERILEDCSNGFSTVFSTSTFASFKGVLLPDGRGTLDGILTYDFFGKLFNIVVNDPSTIDFINSERCDPTEIDCGIAETTGSNILFSDFFETQVEGEPISGNGWTNYNEAGTQNWEAYSEQGSNPSLGISASIGSFSSGDESSIGWLITPQIDFDAQEGETLNFKTSNSFSVASTLELWISSDWDGQEATITSSTWDLLPAAYIVQDDDNFGDWLASGNVDLSCIEGSAYIAWKYMGSGNEAYDGTYELDEIEIRSN